MKPEVHHSEAYERAGISDLVGDTMRLGADLVKTEFALLRAEVAQNIRQVGTGVVTLVFAAVFLIIALGLGAEAAVAALTPVLGSAGLAGAVCAGAAALIALVLALVGLSRLRVSALYPEKTVDSVRSDARLLQRRIS